MSRNLRQDALIAALVTGNMLLRPRPDPVPAKFANRGSKSINLREAGRLDQLAKARNQLGAQEFCIGTPKSISDIYAVWNAFSDFYVNTLHQE